MFVLPGLATVALVWSALAPCLPRRSGAVLLVLMCAEAVGQVNASRRFTLFEPCSSSPTTVTGHQVCFCALERVDQPIPGDNSKGYGLHPWLEKALLCMFGGWLPAGQRYVAVAVG